MKNYYSYEEVRKSGQVYKKGDYKHSATVRPILFRISPDQIIESLEYFAENDPKTLLKLLYQSDIYENVPKDILEKQLAKVPKNIFGKFLADFKEDTYKNFQMIPAIIRRIPEDKIIESFEYLSDPINKKQHVLARMISEYDFYDVDVLIKSLGFEKVVEMLPGEAYYDLPQQWTEALFGNLEIYKALPKIQEEGIVAVLRQISDAQVLSPEIIESLKKYPKLYDVLPKNLAEDEAIQEKFNRTKKIYNKSGYDREGYDREWKNKDGEIIKFFSLYSNFPISSKDDYLKIYEEYKKCGKSVPWFCKKFKISSEEGFHRMLDRISAEDRLESFDIDEQKAETQTKFKNTAYSLMQQVANGEVPIEDLFGKNFNPKFTYEILTRICFDFNTRNKFVKKVAEYFETKDPRVMLKNEILFVKGHSQRKFADNFELITKRELVFPGDRAYSQILNRAKKNLQYCEKGFARKQNYFSYLVDGKSIAVTDEILDQALAYADDNGIYRCNITIKGIAKDIALGKIDYKSKTEETMGEMRDTLKDLLEEKESIEEYLEVMTKQKNDGDEQD